MDFIKLFKVYYLKTDMERNCFKATSINMIFGSEIAKLIENALFIWQICVKVLTKRIFLFLSEGIYTLLAR